ncbi:hypothetical protein SLEP1_g35720 [Rubroshorea leprosula]|uniref:Retrotransposon Copia-like N-terminal domain-containing protein n=1 Tax=Rubroshorea leprosula TaxID=152421 RepID=A0AAV5KP37_9ROSI|nr:hypothetical protein SLEP1_g35720 [Rubroshorea leprosula]
MAEKNETLAIKLDGKNFSLWKFHFQFFVEGKGLWGYIDGTEPMPKASKIKELQQWKMNNAKIVSWILASVHINIGIPMRGFRTAKAMWEHLEKGDKNIQDCYAAFMSLWIEYEQGIMGDHCLKLKQKGINSKQKSNHRVYQATSSPCPKSIPIVSSASSTTNNPSFVEGKDSPISDDVRKLVQNSVSSAITSAFSAIGLSGPSHWDSEREGV